MNTSGNTGKIVVSVFLLLFWGWGTLALYFSGPGPQVLKILLTCVFAVALPVIFFLSRSFRRGALLCLFVFLILLIWWQSLTPTLSKDWAADVAQISHGEIQNDRLTMYNVRNFRYSDENTYTQKWETREYELSRLQGLDIFLSYWGSEHIAHTIMSWDFGNNNHLAVSIETRKDTTQEYSAIRGFFKQYELSYIAADEEDIIKLRTNYRKERVYLYRLQVSKQRSLELLESYLKAMNSLVNKPVFYNALTHNCTTTIHLHSRAIAPEESVLMDWRLIASGHIDELLYDRGIISNQQPFSLLKSASRVDLRMQQYAGSEYCKELHANP